ncbi:fatty acid desaturase [Roseovarius sp. A21]|uniref:Fatty acid desaturase n=1 Tax=Roseovarius bejariae TaxID=2576383 RepID=A0A844CZ87_9RHOB|nr:fatty acid desaturase [Roseovarius bejariae]MRU16406.1 fatty acid desaturase [Roseovarius bejariae]
MTANEIKTHTRNFARKSDALGAFSLLGTFATYMAALWTGATYVTNPLIAIPMVVVLAFASVRLYVLQHDCGHYSLFATRRLNDWAGHLLSLPSLTPYRVMQYNHNLHHAYLGNLDHRETTEVYTMTLAEWQAAPWRRRLWYRLYRNPVLMLGLGGVYAYFIAYRWPVNTRKVGVLGVVLHNIAVLGYVATIWWAFGSAGLAIWAASAVLAGAIGVFLVYLQHNFEDTYWDRKPDLDFHKATLDGSSSLDLGWLWDLGTGNIAYHDLHHFNPGVPSYRLRACQKALPMHLRPHEPIRWPEALRAFRLKLWDEEAERLVPFPKSREDQHTVPAE